jgi:hypothetical protein
MRSSTIFHCLGYAPDAELRDTLDRLFTVSRWAVIKAVV